MESTHKEYYDKLKIKRKLFAKKQASDNTPERLRDKEKILINRMDRLPRNFEQGT